LFNTIIKYDYPVNSALFIKLIDVKWDTKEAELNQKENYRFLVNGTRRREGAKSEWGGRTPPKGFTGKRPHWIRSDFAL